MSSVWAAGMRAGNYVKAVIAGSLLSVVGQILNAVATNSPFFDILIVLAGVWILHKLASHLECAKRPTSSASTAALAAESIQTEELSFTG